MHYALYQANQDNCILMLEHLLQHGMSINNFGNASGLQAGGTPLFIAASRSLMTEAQWLLDHGADPRIEDRLGRIVIQHALHSEQVRQLLREQTERLNSLEAGEKGLTTGN